MNNDMTNSEYSLPALTNPTDLAQAITKNPALIDQVISNVNENLSNSKKQIETIKDRGFFQRLIASNTKDLAEAMLQQSEIMGNFFALLQVLTMGCKRNSAILYDMIDSLSKSEKMTSGEQSNLYGMAKSYLEDALESTQNEQIREDALKRLLVNVKSLNDKFFEVNNRINNLQVRVELLEKMLSENLDDISENLDGLKSNLSKQKTLLSGVNDKIGSLEQDIAKIEENQRVHNAEIESSINKKSIWDSALIKVFLMGISVSALICSIFSLLA